ncbi:tetratricopeptide repeat protein [Streptomyces sp. N2-109]|uniref:Tetratricopeptide repeat protein n=1 Tax=Streptomyces gossypii TaxID=2883101 RepID=A0ABT2JXD7_9ACTN|nr:BTAD domain-containing putative transcriptional regulator [Streptomyces gossypii]MCT2592559.1 tetratricopeptide repeat protein [Streptomyces gossypii]
MRELRLARFNILGTLECLTSDGEQLPSGGLVQERVLVALLLSPDRVLPVSRLVEAVWDEEPPATAAHQVRKAVAELRRRIPGGRDLIVTEGPGYRVAVEPGQLDLTAFSDLVRVAREQAADDNPEAAVDTLREALALWRGPVLVGSGGSVITAASAALEDRRLAALELFFELRLGLGEVGDLVGDLRDLVAAHPFQETLCGQLMLALYRSGRQSEALAEYSRVRRLLADELGVDPDGRVTALHEGILRNSPELATPPRRRRRAVPADTVPTAPAAAPGKAAPAPHASHAPHAPPAEARVVLVAGPSNDPHRCTLPYDLPDFTGRERELEQLLADRHEPDGRRGARIMAIDGMGGSGKTSLANRAAHRLAGQYPDAHLYLDLRGHTPGEVPLPPGAVAEGLLRMLDVPGDRIPDDEAGRTALWRTTVKQYRLVLFLDNTIDSAQVQPLLPASADALVLITSRARLIDLDGAEWLSLGGMPPEDSTALISRMLGEERTAAEPQAVAELVELCAHLPLALRIAAAKLRNRSRWTVQYLVDRLGDETRRLDELRSGTRGVTATLNLTYEGLSPTHQAAFRLLDSHPGVEFDPYCAAALLGTDPGQAEDVLEHLLDTHLMQQYETGRYVFHDLVRSFAKWLRTQAGEDPSEVDQAAAERLLDYYVAATEAACDLAFRGRAPFSRTLEDTPRADIALPVLRNPVRGRQWLDREEENLLAAVTLACRRKAHGHAAELARNVVFQLDSRGRFEEFREVAGIAVAASRELGNQYLLALSLSNLAVADWKLGRFAEGLTMAQEGLELSVRLKDQRGEAKNTGMLGLLLATLGRFGEALPHLEQSIAIKRELGAPRAEAESLTNLSSLFEHMGRYAEAAAAAERSVELNQRIGARENEIVALTDLALARLGLGKDDDARTCLDRALGLCDESAPLGDSALVFALSARVWRGLRETGRAAAHAAQALELTRGSCAPIRQAAVWNILGALRLLSGDHDEAWELHSDAHRIASAMGYRIEMARALKGMADVLAERGDTATADTRRAEAAQLLNAMNAPVGDHHHG